MNNFVDKELTQNWEQLKHILYKNGLFFPRIATKEQDTKQSMDLLAVDQNYNEYRIGFRARKNKYYKYQDFTIRSTEYPKLKTKKVDLYIYCYKDISNTKLQHVYWINIPAIKEYTNVLEIERQQITNNDQKQTRFIVIPFSQMSQYIIYTKQK